MLDNLGRLCKQGSHHSGRQAGSALYKRPPHRNWPAEVFGSLSHTTSRERRRGAVASTAGIHPLARTPWSGSDASAPWSSFRSDLSISTWTPYRSYNLPHHTTLVAQDRFVAGVLRH